MDVVGSSDKKDLALAKLAATEDDDSSDKEQADKMSIEQQLKEMIEK